MTNFNKRTEYVLNELLEENILDDPLKQFAKWWQEAKEQDINYLDAAHLSTVDDNNSPDCRIVLLKHFGNDGFSFFSNYESPKAQQLEKNNHACLLIFWPTLERQVRIKGSIQKTSRLVSTTYFASRPRGAQIGAWASKQSKVLSSRRELENSFKLFEEQFKNTDVLCPPHWGGFSLMPTYYEFWQGRLNRLHDRFAFTKDQGLWRKNRLSP